MTRWKAATAPTEADRFGGLGLMLAARITLPHFSRSPAICFPKIRRASLR
jgi:hypothetical protein